MPIKENGKFQPDSRAFIHSQGRVPYNNAVKKIEKELGFNIQTSKDSLGREFAGNIDWIEAGMLNQALEVKTPYAKQEVDYLHALYLASEKQLQLRYVKGNLIKPDLAKKLFEDKVKKQSPWRASWLDNDFKTNGEDLEVHYNHIFYRKKKIIDYKSEVLDKDTLIENKQIDVLDYITKNHTSQGLISKDVKLGKFYSYNLGEDNNSVAGFYAVDNRAYFVCDRNPANRLSYFGVESVAD
ncbi:MAG: hypothetical protein U9Q99_02170 [Nanoarchaeota archaeon]|nr:hypothetical protein [Nanoarchaeota archaeon]